MINYKWLGIPGVAEQFIQIPVCRSLLESECGCSRTRTKKIPARFHLANDNKANSGLF